MSFAFFLGDGWCSGRIARGEQHASLADRFDDVKLATQATRQTGAIVRAELPDADVVTGQFNRPALDEMDSVERIVPDPHLARISLSFALGQHAASIFDGRPGDCFGLNLKTGLLATCSIPRGYHACLD